jgi:hypothetical protein
MIRHKIDKVDHIRVIKVLNETNLPLRTVALRFGVSETVISKINREYNVRPFKKKPRFLD